MNQARTRALRLLFVCLAAVLVVGALLARTTQVQGDDPDSDPRTYLAQGSVFDAKTVTANQAHANELERQEELRGQNALAHPERMPPKGGPMPAYTPRPEPTRIAGIYPDGGQHSGWGTLYKIENLWSGPVPNGYAAIYAGVKTDVPGRFVVNAPGQGVLIVGVARPGQGEGRDSSREYLTPTRSGPVKILSWAGTRLRVGSTLSNTTFVFDVATLAWISATP